MPMSSTSMGRDPATLSVSVDLWAEHLRATGAPRVDLLAGYREFGISRVMGLNLDTAGSELASGG
jgi:hypothetical protein